MDFGFQDQVFVVTGATSGFGEGIARVASAEGAYVVIHGRDKGRAERLAAELPRDRSHVVLSDLEDPQNATLPIEEAMNQFGRIDVLVNNAGIAPNQDVALEDIPLHDVRRTLAVNLEAAIVATHAYFQVLKRQTRRRRANVIFIASTAGMRGEPYNSVYAASKGGLIAFMRSVAREIATLAPEGRANAVAPGWADTPMPASRAFLKDAGAVGGALQGRCTPRLTSVADVVGAVCFLASSFSAGINGTVLEVSCGMEVGGRRLWSPDDPLFKAAVEEAVREHS